MINKQDKNEMYNNLNLGSLCQIIKLKKLYLSCNQYYNHYTDIKSGVKVVEREDNRSSSWDNFNNEYVQQNDTYVVAYCRKTGVFEYKDTEFSDESYQDTEYVITRIVDINDDIYVGKILSDIHHNNENAKMSSFDRTPIFAREFYEDPYCDSLEELELELELEELEA